VLFQDETKCFGFDNEEFASYFIAEDEFSPLTSLNDDYRRILKVPPGFEVQPPTWESREVDEFKYVGEY